MKKILAVSGGVDSMALMHIFRDDENAVVAHFDHGARPSSADDREFVRQKTAEYGLPFETAAAELGAGVSEEKARRARYVFLRGLAEKYAPAEIYTAHHLDDLVESMAINLLRGTGWRGIAPLDAPGVVRPFLVPGLLPDGSKFPRSKADNFRYAAEHGLAFREDPTNHEDGYLRNRIRICLQKLDPEDLRALEMKCYDLWRSQCILKREIEAIDRSLLPTDGLWSREFFMGLDDDAAFEILKFALAVSGVPATGPQIRDFLNAIRTFAPEKSFNLPGGRLVRIRKTCFRLS